MDSSHQTWSGSDWEGRTLISFVSSGSPKIKMRSSTRAWNPITNKCRAWHSSIVRRSPTCWVQISFRYRKFDCCAILIETDGGCELLLNAGTASPLSGGTKAYASRRCKMWAWESVLARYRLPRKFHGKGDPHWWLHLITARWNTNWTGSGYSILCTPFGYIIQFVHLFSRSKCPSNLSTLLQTSRLDLWIYMLPLSYLYCYNIKNADVYRLQNMVVWYDIVWYCI